MKRLSAIDTALCLAILVVVGVTLAPAVARIQRNPADARCQSNLQRIAEAMALYLEDNHNWYPTNRAWGQPFPTLGRISQAVNLPPNPDDRFAYGLTWVEALDPYLKSHASQTGQDWLKFWRCPNATSYTYPPSTYARVNYAFSVCLVEQPPMYVRNAKNLMMLREIGRTTGSMLRPMNDAGALPNRNRNYPPQHPFLNRTDNMAFPPLPYYDLEPYVYLLHANGSNVAMADGHVQHFTIDYYPEQSQITAARCWDGITQQWYNYFWSNPATQDQMRLNKTIAISP